MSRYRPISDYGAIGNLQTAALIGRDGAVDWLCLPHFDSPSIFAGLLDANLGGRFSITPSILFTTEQFYEPFTNVLVTRFITASGGAELVDFMPPYTSAAAAGGRYHPELHRGLRGVWGEVPFRVVCDPRPDYGQSRPDLQLTPSGCVFRGGGVRLALSSDFPLGRGELGIVAEGSISHGMERWLVLRHCSHPGCDTDLFAAGAGSSPEQYRRTLDFWRAWADRCRYHGRWRQEVIRSALVIKLLTFAPTGALVAAPTTSLPELLGGSLNWDYRFCWLRDAALALKALLRLGYVEETQAFFGWLEARSLEPGGLQALYGIDGRRDLPEHVLPHLEGYRGSRPVRIGNAAHTQLQLDVYGEVMNTLHHTRRLGFPVNDESWRVQLAMMHFLEEAWKEPDEGIWEVRGPRRHFTHSKVMAWVAFDRAATAVEKFGRKGPAARWRAIADKIRAEVLERGFDRGRNAFVQHYESQLPDGSLLMLPSLGFIPADDPRMVGTVDLIRRELETDGLIRRYKTVPDVDGLPPGEGAFLLCTFWLADVLALQGKQEEAEEIFERLLSIRNDVGLLAEQYDPTSRRQMGNFPQAFSHTGLINTARNLEHPGGPAADRQQA